MLVTFDTQEVVNELKSHGFTDEQAEILTKIQKKVIQDSMDNTLATKSDMQESKIELKGDINGLDKKIDQINTQLVVVKWMLGVVIAVGVLPLLKQML